MRHYRSGILTVLTVTLWLGVAACSPAAGPAEDPAPETPAAAVVPDLEAAGQATYVGVWDDAAVTLNGGRFEDTENRQMAWLVSEISAAGDLDGDGAADLAVVVGENSGGSGSYVFVTALLAGGEGEPLPVALVGDRVQLRSMVIESGEIRLDVVQAGEQDPMCCPGELATRRWVVRDGALQEEPVDAGARLSLEAIAGSWTLAAWNVGEAAQPQEPITLTVEGTRLAGHSGCNQYTTESVAGEVPGELSIGPVAGTRMMCEGPRMEAETRYLTALGGAVNFGFLNGRLAITSNVGDEYSTLLFDRTEQ